MEIGECCICNKLLPRFWLAHIVCPSCPATVCESCIFECVNHRLFRCPLCRTPSIAPLMFEFALTHLTLGGLSFYDKEAFLLFLTNNTLPYSDFGVEDASVIDFAPPTQLNGNNGEWTNGDDVNGRHLRQQARNAFPSSLASPLPLGVTFLPLHGRSATPDAAKRVRSPPTKSLRELSNLWLATFLLLSCRKWKCLL